MPGTRDEALALSNRLGLGLSEVWALNALGDLELGQGRPEEALLLLRGTARGAAARGINDVDLWPAPELVEVYLRIGRRRHGCRDRGQAFGREAAVKAAAVGTGESGTRSRARRSRGPVRGVLRRGRRSSRRDARRLRGCPHSSCLWLTLAEAPAAGESPRAATAGDRHVRRPRRRAMERDRPYGARRHRGDGRRRDPASLTQLTPQELQIAMLLAERRTTREAAAALFLSPKTVEYHLRSVYRKLGVATRDELATAMGRTP